MDLCIPKAIKSLRCALGLMFAHYCCWIASFSEKIHSRLAKGPFPLTEEAENAFSSFKADMVLPNAFRLRTIYHSQLKLVILNLK